jgi:hypothetical protein
MSRFLSLFEVSGSKDNTALAALNGGEQRDAVVTIGGVDGLVYAARSGLSI